MVARSRTGGEDISFYLSLSLLNASELCVRAWVGREYATVVCSGGTTSRADSRKDDSISLFVTIGSIVLYSVGNSQLQNKCVVLFGRRCVHHEGLSVINYKKY